MQTMNADSETIEKFVGWLFYLLLKKIRIMKKILFLFFFATCTASAFAQANMSSTAKKDFGKNIVAFEPVYLISRNFVGVGVSYEHMANPYLGLRIPVMVGINNNYVNVGLEAKLYPTKNTGPVKYAIAPMLMVGIGQNKVQDNFYDKNGNYILHSYTEKASHLGFLLNHTLNVTISRQFFIGIEGGMGINYYDEAANNLNGSSQISFVAQMQVGMGIRF